MLTAVDIATRFGPIPLHRIVLDPSPGEATEDDVLDHLRRTGRVCELVDGILVEKDVSYHASVVAAELIRLLGNFVRERRLGFISGEAGLTRLPVGRTRGPDVAFVSKDRLSGSRLRQPIPALVPNLVVEVLSPGNTRQEMEEKLDDYFGSSVELVWYVDPQTHTVRVYTSRDVVATLNESDTLEGGTVLPGFSVKVADLFADEPE